MNNMTIMKISKNFQIIKILMEMNKLMKNLMKRLAKRLKKTLMKNQKKYQKNNIIMNSFDKLLNKIKFISNFIYIKFI